MTRGAGRDTDRAGFCFWPLPRIVSALDEFGNNKDLRTHLLDPRLKDYFIFADYLHWSWAYAIRLTGDIDARGAIFKVDEPTHLSKVADSFTEFVALYLSDSSRLYERSRVAEPM
jgi:hypothetical protein